MKVSAFGIPIVPGSNIRTSIIKTNVCKIDCNPEKDIKHLFNNKILRR